MNLLCYNALICFFSFTVIDTSQTAWCYLCFLIYMLMSMSLWMMHWRPFTLSHISPLPLSTYTPGGVMKELHACFQWNTPEKDWIPSWIRDPWRMGEEELCCICVSCLNYIPWASRSLDTYYYYYYYIYHYRILPSTFAYNMNGMVSKTAISLESYQL